MALSPWVETSALITDKPFSRKIRVTSDNSPTLSLVQSSNLRPCKTKHTQTEILCEITLDATKTPHSKWLVSQRILNFVPLRICAQLPPPSTSWLALLHLDLELDHPSGEYEIPGKWPTMLDQKLGSFRIVVAAVFPHNNSFTLNYLQCIIKMNSRNLNPTKKPTKKKHKKLNILALQVLTCKTNLFHGSELQNRELAFSFESDILHTFVEICIHLQRGKRGSSEDSSTWTAHGPLAGSRVAVAWKTTYCISVKVQTVSKRSFGRSIHRTFITE